MALVLWQNKHLRQQAVILLQAARLETAQELAFTQPEKAQVILEQYNAANAAVVEGAIQICHDFAAQMQNMSHEERVEFIAEVVAEIALTKSSTKFWLAATGKALNAAGKGVRKIAQVVEEVNPAKPKAVAVTPEGIMLDAAEVLEADANPIAEVAQLEEGAAVEGKAAAQGVQAAKEAEAVAKAKPVIEEAHPVEAIQERVPAAESPQQITEQGKSPAAEGMQERNPLDRRNMTPEQLEAEAARKAQGQAIRDNGRLFEEQLQERFGGHGSFKGRGKNSAREFDGAYGNVWYEAKAGKYWERIESNPDFFSDFRSDMMDRFKIATENGKLFELYTNSPIPVFVKEWLNSEGIKFVEFL